MWQVIERSRPNSGRWSTVSGLHGIPDELEAQTRETVAASNSQCGWIKYDMIGDNLGSSHLGPAPFANSKQTKAEWKPAGWVLMERDDNGTAQFPTWHRALDLPTPQLHEQAIAAVEQANRKAGYRRYFVCADVGQQVHRTGVAR